MGGNQLNPQRFGAALINLFIILILGFFALRFFPGSPLAEEAALHSEIKQVWAKKLGLDQALAQQFFFFIQNLPWVWDQPSFSYFGVSAGQVFYEAFAVTVRLNLMSLICVIFFGYSLALGAYFLNITSGLKKVRIFLFALPSLFLAPLLIWFFSFYLGWLPWRLDSGLSYLLPVLLVALRPSFSLASMVSEKIERFIISQPARVHQSLGFSFPQLIFKWGFKECLNPLVSQFPHFTASILSGSFLIEVLFSARGLGVLFVDSLGQRDLPVLLVLILFYAVVVLVAQLISDLFMPKAVWKMSLRR